MKFANQKSVMSFCGMLLILTFCCLPTFAFKHLKEGMKAPSVAGTDILTGTQVSSDELHSNNIVVVIFWASWSERSLEELQDFKALSTEYEEYPLSIIAVNVEGQSTTPVLRDSLSRLVSELDLPFPTIFDTGLELFYRYGVIAVPSTAIIDRSGVLRYGPPGYSLTTRDRLVDSIRAYLGIRDTSEAITRGDGYIPTDKASRYYHLAVRLTMVGNHKQALQNLNTAQQCDENFAAIYTLRGDILLKLDSLDAALAQFTRAIALDSNSVQARTGLGQTFYKKGETEFAAASLNQAVEIDSNYTPAWICLGMYSSESGDTEQALKYLQHARSLNSRDPEVYRLLGHLYSASGDMARAVESLQTGLKILYPGP